MTELNQVELNHDDRCPCSSGEVYGACCGRFLGEFA
ncbi:SEC-C metal-binding domain-containing protein, partial [uncultured Rothia sp.]